MLALDININRQSEPTPSHKLGVFTGILPLISANKNIIVSGSLSQILSEASAKGPVNASDLDLSPINDIDLAFCGGEYRANKQTIISLASHQGRLPINTEYLADAFSGFNDQKGLGKKIITIVHQGQEYHLQVMTPAYLLVTLVDQDVGDPTPAEKYQRKVLEIQKLSTFNPSDFLTIAHYDIKSRYLMNKDTFNHWKDMNEGEDKEIILRNFDTFSSIVNLANFMNALKLVTSTQELDYDEVRRVTNLELFVREFESR